MFTRVLFVVIATGLLALPSAAQPPGKQKPRKELEALRLQVQELQARIAALEQQIREMQKKDQIAPILPVAPDVIPSAEGLDLKIVTGIDGYCMSQYFPGVPGAAIPKPTLYRGIVTVRVFPLKGEKPIAEGVSNKEGRFRIALPPGEYRLEAQPKNGGTDGSGSVPVTVQERRLTPLKLTFTQLGV